MLRHILSNILKEIVYYLSIEMEVTYFETGKAFIHHYFTAEPSYGAG